jgi:hypothetical protein
LWFLRKSGDIKGKEKKEKKRRRNRHTDGWTATGADGP